MMTQGNINLYSKACYDATDWPTAKDYTPKESLENNYDQILGPVAAETNDAPINFLKLLFEGKLLREGKEQWQSGGGGGPYIYDLHRQKQCDLWTRSYNLRTALWSLLCEWYEEHEEALHFLIYIVTDYNKNKIITGNGLISMNIIHHFRADPWMPYSILNQILHG